MTPFRLAIMTTTHERPELTAAVCDWWAGLSSPEGIYMRGFAGGDFDARAYDHFWDHKPAENEPLGQKHNIVLRRCAAMRPDGVMVIGSDDIVEPSLIGLSCDAIQKGAMWTQPKDLYFWHPETGRVSTPQSKNLTGAGRVYSARLLEVMGWHLWDDDKEANLDSSAEQNITNEMRARKIVWGDVHRGWPWAIGGDIIPRAVLDIKSGVNLWPYEDAVGITQASDHSPAILKRFGTERLAYRWKDDRIVSGPVAQSR